MKKIIAGRHVELDDNLKRDLMAQLVDLEDRFRKLTSGRVVVDLQKSRYHVEVILNGKNVNIEAEGRGSILAKAVDAAFAKAEKQLRRKRERQREYQHVSVAELEIARMEAEAAEDAEAEAEGELPRAAEA